MIKKEWTSSMKKALMLSIALFFYLFLAASSDPFVRNFIISKEFCILEDGTYSTSEKKKSFQSLFSQPSSSKPARSNTISQHFQTKLPNPRKKRKRSSSLLLLGQQDRTQSSMITTKKSYEFLFY